MIAYLLTKPEKIYIPLIEHIQLVLITLLISVLIAGILSFLAVMIPKLGDIFMQAFSVIYSIPSLAMFALLIPVTGLGRTSAVIVLVLYNQYLLLRNFIVGLNEVDPAVREAARGLGMTGTQVLFRIQVPLAKRALFAGIRLAVVSTVGIGTIAASINAGGLGTLLFEGLRTMNTVKIIWGSLMSVALAVSLNSFLGFMEKRMA